MGLDVRLAGRLLLGLIGLALLWCAPAAASPVELIERGCRIETAPDVTVEQILARPAAAPCPPAPGPNARGTIWVDYGTADFVTDFAMPWRLLIDGTRVRSIDLYVQRADGSIERSHYDPFAPDRHWSPGGYYSMSIMTAASPPVRVLLRFGGMENMSLLRSVRAVSWGESIGAERRNAALFGVAVGILGVTILFHMTLFFAIRRRFQLFYCANVATMFGFGLAYSGVLHFIVPLSGPATVRLISAFITATCATGVAFLVDFVERRALPRWLRNWAYASVGVTAAVALSVVATPLSWTTETAALAQLAGAHAILLTWTMLGVALWRGSRTARLLALCWSAPIAIAALFPLRASGLVGHFDIPDGILLYAATLECMLLSLPVADRIRRLRIDHERARERQHVLERQARTDALTGLANRHGFVDAVDRTFGSGAQTAALLMIDIDHFKRINDRYGHGHGDMILRLVAGHVAKSAGSGAIVARFGGEEFIVAVRGHDERRAATIAERIRVGMTTLGDGGFIPAEPVTVSIGIACGRSDAINALIDEADAALYEAKRRGRDRVVLAGEAREPEGVAAAA